MFYSSRVYRQRNPKPQDESKEKPFFSKQKQDHKGKNNDAFFQARLALNEPGDTHEKVADSVADTVVNQGQGKSIVQQKNDPSKEKEKTVQKKEDPLKEKEKTVQKKGEDDKKEKEIH